MDRGTRTRAGDPATRTRAVTLLHGRQDQGLVTLSQCQGTKTRAGDPATGSGDKNKGWCPCHMDRGTRTRAGDPATRTRAVTLLHGRQDQGLVTLSQCQGTKTRAGDPATGSGDKNKGWCPCHMDRGTRTRAGDPATRTSAVTLLHGRQDQGLVTLSQGQGDKSKDW